MNQKTLWICRNALGIALFVVLSLCIQVPVFQNYYLCLGYTVLVVYAGLSGPVSAALTGTFGVILYCMITGGLRGMPGWAAGNLLIGLLLGYMMQKLSKHKASPWKYAFLILWILIITAAGILGIKSIVECLLYSQPFLIRAGKNSYAFVADTVVLWTGIPVYETVKHYTGRSAIRSVNES